MELSKQSIQEFKQIYLEDYGIKLTNEQAFELACKFFAMMQVVCRKIPEKD